MCVQREQFWIDKTNACDSDIGYNLSPTAGNTLGVKHTLRARYNMRLARVGKKISEVHRANMVASLRRQEVRDKIRKTKTGSKHSEKTKQRMSRVRLGKKLSSDHCARISAGCIGRRLTEQAKQKISKANRGKKLSEAHKANIGKGCKGIKWSEEAKQRMRETKRRKCADPAFRKKMSEVVRKQWIERRKKVKSATVSS